MKGIVTRPISKVENADMYRGDLAIIIVNRNRPDLADQLVEQLQTFGTGKLKDIYVIECGSDLDKRSKYASFYYPDPDFRGKCFGHNQGLQYVLNSHGRYRYYWLLMNDVSFEKDPDPINTMVDILQSEDRMGILSPVERGKHYPGARPDILPWHKVSSCHYLGLMMKDACLQEVGFLNPEFKYSWGAILELSFKIYSAGWYVAYCDVVVMKHFGGTTYGKVAGTITRAEYVKKATEWAAKYFEETYGPQWDELFTSRLPNEIEFNTYKFHRRFWEYQKKKYVSRLGRIKAFLNLDT